MYENDQNNINYTNSAPSGYETVYPQNTYPTYPTYQAPPPYEEPKRKMGFGHSFVAVALIAVISCTSAGIGLGLGSSLGNIINLNQTSANSQSAEPEATSVPTLTFIEEGTNDVAEEIKETSEETASQSKTAILAHEASDSDVVSVISAVSNSVVSIKISGVSRDIFNRATIVPSAGSGIIFSEDEANIYIVTNHHVIENAQTVEISIDDDTSVAASPMGSDIDNDIAVIKVSKADLIKAQVTDYKIATFGDSNAMEVGETVIAIGNALGEGKSATLGIISAKNKQVSVESSNYVNVIQTDAAINKGNSGGALVNLKGQVIGINTVKVFATGAEGMGFAIPSDTVKETVDKIMIEGSVERPFLGITGMTIDDRIKDVYSLSTKGVYVVEISENSGANAAGIRQGDIITTFNGVTINDMEGLQEEIAKTAVGSVVDIIIYRGADQMTLSVEMKNANAYKSF